MKRLSIWVSLLTAISAPSSGADLTLEDCGGFREITALPVVTTWPDTNTLVYEAAYVVGPGAETILRGETPSARWWSYALVDQARREVDQISDFEIATDAAGAYEIAIRLDCAGADNCLEIGSNAAGVVPGRIFYRLYVPDEDETGGAPLPTVTYRAEGPEAEVTGVGAGMCHALLREAVGALDPGASPHDADDQEGALFSFLASPSGLENPVCEPGEAPPVNRSRGTGAAQIDMIEEAGAPAELVEALRRITGTGSFGSTEANAYASALYNLRLGNVELRSRAPTYARQHPGEEANDLWRDPGAISCGQATGDPHCEEPQTRYWSVCASQATRPTDCIRDENVVVDPDGFFRIVVAPECPIAGYPAANCLRGGVTSAAGLGGAAFLLFRNTLVRADFYNELGPNDCDADGDGVIDPAEAETVFCGEYTPVVRYLERSCS